jgi:hypothetical protein
LRRTNFNYKRRLATARFQQHILENKISYCTCESTKKMSAHVAAYHEKAYTDGFFHVSGDHGFLPISEPLKTLPERYAALQSLLDEMPTNKVYPSVPGTLATPNAIVTAVEALPDFTSLAEQETDVFVIQALYRAYAFLGSAYTLELSYQQYVIDGNYGKARTLLPANVAKPLVAVSQKLDVYPFLDYHYAYSLGNYVKIDPAGTLHWKNLNMACRFSGTPDEIGFIMLHVCNFDHTVIVKVCMNIIKLYPPYCYFQGLHQRIEPFSGGRHHEGGPRRGRERQPEEDRAHHEGHQRAPQGDVGRLPA